MTQFHLRLFSLQAHKLIITREEVNSNTQEYLEYRGAEEQDHFYSAAHPDLPHRCAYRITRYRPRQAG